MTSRNYRNTPELVIGLRNSKPDAFEFVYEKYSPALYTIILQILKDEAIAAEALCEVFMTMPMKIATYHADDGSLFCWLFRLTREVALANSISCGPTTGLTGDPGEMHADIANSNMAHYPSSHDRGLKISLFRLSAQDQTVINYYVFGQMLDDNVPGHQLPEGVDVAEDIMRSLAAFGVKIREGKPTTG